MTGAGPRNTATTGERKRLSATTKWLAGIVAAIVAGVVVVIIEHTVVNPPRTQSPGSESSLAERRPAPKPGAPGSVGAVPPDSTPPALVGVLPPVPNGWKCRQGFETLPEQGYDAQLCMAAVNGQVHHTAVVRGRTTMRLRLYYWLSYYTPGDFRDVPVGQRSLCTLDVRPGRLHACPVLVADPPEGMYHVAASTEQGSENGLNSDAWRWSGDDLLPL